ncbi:hypothetical protein BOW10_12250, partial [Solemya velum gill symbiont]
MGNVQTGEGPGDRRESPQPGPSESRLEEDAYTIRLRSQRTFAKTAAVERTYRVKVGEFFGGKRLTEIRRHLHQMFADVIRQARGDMSDNDLGRVVIHHPALQNPIVVQLLRLELLDAETVMATIEKVLQSHESLTVDSAFEIDVGLIRLPKGGARRRITDIHGAKNSITLKRSIVTIENTDQLCMARALAVVWAKLHKCTKEEWADVTTHRGRKSNLDLVL